MNTERKPNRKRKIRFFHYYYNKLMLLSTILICVFAILYGALASHSVYQNERMKLLKEYEEVLLELHSIYQTKQDDFYNLMLSFFDHSEGFDAVSHLLESENHTLSDLNAFDRQAIQSLLHEVCSKDKDIQAVVLYKSLTDSFIIYNPYARILQEVSGTPLFNELKQPSLNRQLIGVRDLSLTGAYGQYRRHTVYAYGLSGNLSTRNISMIKNPGKVLILYNVTGLQRALFNKNLPLSGRFLLTTLKGQIIFDTWQNYPEGNDPYTVFPFVDLLNGQQTTAIIDEELCVVSAVVNEKRGYIVAYYVPEKEIKKACSAYSRIILLGSYLFLVLGIFVFVLSTHLSTKRINQLEKGMKQVGSNNLDYRIPIGRTSDEFTAIAEKFNAMCDELEQTINQVYVYNLRQKTAELYALQASINSHFLYNTLEAIRVNLQEAGNDDAAEMIVILAKLYRNQTKGGMFVTLREELSQCNLYLELFSLRHDHILDTHLYLPPDLEQIAVPKNIIQPIVENFIVHAMRGRHDCSLVMTAWREDGDIFLQFDDDGTGIEPDHLTAIREKLANRQETSLSGFGLSNVHERLKIVYGDHYGLDISNHPDRKGVRVLLRIQALSLGELEHLYKSRQTASALSIEAISFSN